MEEFLKYLTYYHLFGYSLFGLLLLWIGFTKRKRIIVEISQFFSVIPICGLIIYELDSFRETEAISIRLLVTLFYTIFMVFFIVIAKRKVGIKAGILIWFLILGFLFLVSIASFSYYKKYYTYDDGRRGETLFEKYKEKEEAWNYTQFIEIKNFVAESYKDIDEGESIMVSGEIDNTGNIVVNSLSIKVILLGVDKSQIYNEILPVVMEQNPLLPRKGIEFKWRLREKPRSWPEGAFTYMVKSLKLAGHRLETDFEGDNEKLNQ
ncbi:hypothetical protein KKB18_06855 [bacterium]|nr:hypothetical protein [bacterium]